MENTDTTAVGTTATDDQAKRMAIICWSNDLDRVWPVMTRYSTGGAGTELGSGHDVLLAGRGASHGGKTTQSKLGRRSRVRLSSKNPSVRPRPRRRPTAVRPPHRVESESRPARRRRCRRHR